MFVKERFELDQYTCDLLLDMEPPFGNSFGEFLFYRTYSRNIDGHQENWADCIIRVINGVMSIRKDHYVKNHIFWDQKYWKEFSRKLSISAFKMQWLPGGRGLFHCGTEFTYERGSMALYNCSYLDLTDNLGDDIAWLMDCLMLGVGVGFSPIRNDNLKLKNPKGSFEFVIPDSREGWCESEKLLIESYLYGSSKPKMIYDEIRGPDLPIKGFGGLSSGPKPLMEYHKQTEYNLDRHITDKYYDSVILKTDLANQAGVAICAGNIRRSAELAQLSINDPTFKDLKDYNKYPQREAWGWLSNNSVDLEERHDFDKLNEIAERVIIRGEPGIKNLRNFPKGRIGKKDKLRKDIGRNVNPCLPGWSKILTQDGLRDLNEVGINDLIWSENGWTKIINKWSTGTNKVYKYITTAGTFYGTDNHQIISEGHKIEVQYAESIDRLLGLQCDITIEESNLQDTMDGLLIGDGENKENVILLNIGDNDHDYFDELNRYIFKSYNHDKGFKVSTTLYPEELPRVFDRIIPERFFKGDNNKKCSFLRGLYSANGSICGNRITLKTSSFKIIESVQLMLSSIGIYSYYTTNKTTMVEFKNGKYQCKESYDLNISQGRKLFAKCVGFIQKYKTEKLNNLIGNVNKNKGHKETFEIIKTELISEEETFDITVDNPYHTFWNQGLNVSNCSEIILESKEVCNIAETFPTVCENVEEWYEACQYSTFYCSTVSLLPTHQPETNKIIAKNRR